MTSLIEKEFEGKEISAKVDLDDISEINTSRIWFTKEDVINVIQKAREELNKFMDEREKEGCNYKLIRKEIEQVLGK